MGCCCYSFFGINECITLADDTAYSFCEYSQLSVNGYLHKTDTWCWSLPFFSHFTIERTVFKFTFRWATATFLMSMLRGETAYCGFGFYTPPQNPLTLSANLYNRHARVTLRRFSLTNMLKRRKVCGNR